MSENDAPGWRQLCLRAAKRRIFAQSATLDIQREVDEVVAWLSREGLKHFDLHEFREFLRADPTTTVPELGFGEGLRREVWWSMVRGLAPVGARVPRA